MSRKINLILVGILLGSLLLHISLFKGFIVDDAFITFRYVQQTVHGHGIVYNQGERVEGYSNFLWLLLLTPFARLGVDLTYAAKGLGILFSLLTLVLTWRASHQVEGPVLAPLFLVCSAPFAAWAMGGLETPLFTFLLLCSGYFFLQEETRGRGCLSGFLFGLLSLTRPEGLLFALVAIIFRAMRLFHIKARPGRHDFARLLLLGAVIFPYHLWRLTYYGQILPNTIYAKSLGLHPRAFLEGIFYIYQSLTALGGFFLYGASPFFLLCLPPTRQHRCFTGPST